MSQIISLDSGTSPSQNRGVPSGHVLSPFDWLMISIVAMLACVEVLLARAVHLNGLNQLATSLPGLPGVAIMGGLHVYCRWRRFPRLVEATRLAIWAGFLTGLLGLMMQISGRSAAPLQDVA